MKKTNIEMNINISTPKPEIKKIDFPKSIRLDRYDIKIWVKWEIIDWKRTEKWLVYKDSWSLFINCWWLDFQWDTRNILISKWEILWIDVYNNWFLIKRKWEKSIFFWDLEDDDLYPQLDNIKEFLIKNKISNGDLDDEELINQAITIISETRKASATMLQRKLNIWFARAARIIDVLEERWIIGPQEWAKPREIYI